MTGKSPDVLRQDIVIMDGGFNFRDIGGYKTRCGRIVRSGRVYRSGMMAHLTASDHVRLADLGVRVICDFRTTVERAAAPTSWQATRAEYWFRDYDDSLGDIGRLMARMSFSAEDAHAAMVANYRVLPFEQADAYRELFKRIAEGHLPLVFNCTAGKDRTGVATALLYTLLDVPRDMILQEYVLTNDLIGRDAARLAARGTFRKWREDSDFAPLVRAETAYLVAMFKALEERFGTIANYLKDALGIDHECAEAVRNELLEPST